MKNTQTRKRGKSFADLRAKHRRIGDRRSKKKFDKFFADFDKVMAQFQVGADTWDRATKRLKAPKMKRMEAPVDKPE